MKLRAWAILSGALMIAMIGGLWLYASLRRADLEGAFAQCGAGQIGGDISGPFTLMDENAALVSDKDVLTKPSLVYFGYTFCPDVCPLDSARNAQVTEILEGMGHEVTPVFISVDPERDTPEVLREFTDYFHPRMIGLTGTPEQVQSAAQAYRAYYRKHASEDAYYLVDHSTFTYLVLPQRGFVDFFSRDEPPEAMVERIACFLESAN